MIRVRFYARTERDPAEEQVGQLDGGRLTCAGSTIEASEAPPLEIVEIEGDDSDLAKALAAGYRVTHPEGWKRAKSARQSALGRARAGWPEGAEEILSNPDLSHAQAAQATGMEYRTVVQTRKRLYPDTLNPQPWRNRPGRKASKP